MGMKIHPLINSYIRCPILRVMRGRLLIRTSSNCWAGKKLPGRFTKICPTTRLTKRWKTFWKELHKLELLALHLFHFGSCVPTFDLAAKIRKFYLCSQSVLRMVFFHTPITNLNLQNSGCKKLGFPNLWISKRFQRRPTPLMSIGKIGKEGCTRKGEEAPEGSDPVSFLPWEMKRAWANISIGKMTYHSFILQTHAS